MAADIFFKTGVFKGEVQDEKHKDEIAVLGFSFGVDNFGTAGINTGTGASRLNAKNLKLRKYMDMASPNLFLFCANGKPIDECTLTVRKAGGTALEYAVFTLNTCMISSVNILGPDATDMVVEEVEVNYGKLKYQYTPQSADGTGGSAVVATVDLPKGKFG